MVGAAAEAEEASLAQPDQQPRSEPEAGGSSESSASDDEQASTEGAGAPGLSAAAGAEEAGAEEGGAEPGAAEEGATGTEAGREVDGDPPPAAGLLDAPGLTCLLGPKQRQKALLQKQRQKREQRDARAHWMVRWREYTKLHPEIVGAEREEMKAAFDSMQIGEMRDDALCRTPKAHFSAVMSDLRRSRVVRDRELGTWIGYEPSRGADAPPKGRRKPRTRHRGRGGGDGGGEGAGQAEAAAEGEAPAEAPPEEACEEDPMAVVTATLSVGKGLLGGLSGQAAAEFGRDLYILQTKFAVTVEVMWEESDLHLEGERAQLASARKELGGILNHYFPGEAFAEVKVLEKSAPRHWADVKCNLTEAQMAKVLAQTQEDREKQRNAVLHWADRWEAYVRGNPELVQSTRVVMKEGFERMLAAELGPETPGKVHFGLVMNFLRQSGRRQIAVWKDYAPKGWIG